MLQSMLAIYLISWLSVAPTLAPAQTQANNSKQQTRRAADLSDQELSQYVGLDGRRHHASVANSGIALGELRKRARLKQEALLQIFCVRVRMV
jgi:hypothetical protein